MRGRGLNIHFLTYSYVLLFNERCWFPVRMLYMLLAVLPPVMQCKSCFFVSLCREIDGFA